MTYVDRSPILAGLNYAKGQILTQVKVRGHHSGSTALSMPVKEATGYIRQVVSDYVAYGAGNDAGRLQGKDILEIGPGDNLGVALLLLAQGARTVTCVDGFAPSCNAQHNAQVYGSLYSSFSTEERERVKDVVTPQSNGTATVGGNRLISRYETPIDVNVTPLELRSYDVIISRAVLEHLGNLELGWRNMVRCLRPGGEIWHKVDFRCHNLFGQIHPLHFLTIPDTLWNFISRPDPTLNRLRLPTYRDLAKRDFLESCCFLTHILDNDEILPHVTTILEGTHYNEQDLERIRRIRPLLVGRFSDYSDEELLVTGVFLIARGVGV